MILFVNACVRKESGTLFLAQEVLKKYDDEVQTVELQNEKLIPLDRERLELRNELTEKGEFSDDIFRFAKQLAKAERIVIAAPYWDLSFPSLLKIYIELICAMNVTCSYSDEGIPVSHCRAKELVYVTTAGGYIPERNFGFDYIKEVFSGFFGVKTFRYVKAEGLDIYGNDREELLEKTVKEIKND